MSSTESGGVLLKIRSAVSQISTAIAAVSLATFTLPAKPWNIVLFILGSAAIILAVIGETRNSDHISDLRAKGLEDQTLIEEARLQLKGSAHIQARTVQEVLVALTGLCGGDGNSVRTSVYKRHGDIWQRAGRYSANALYRESGRREIPLRHGLLFRALERSVADADSLPDRTRAPVQFEKEQVALGLPVGLSGGLTMPSRSYALFRFEAQPSDETITTFVVCFESTEPQAFSPDELARSLAPWWQALHWVFSHRVESRDQSQMPSSM